MKAYGLPRTLDIQYPDLHTFWYFGLKGYPIENKKKTRRIWKKRERARMARELQREME
jgi:hypothetical protein